MMENRDHYNLNSVCHKGRKYHNWLFLWQGGDHTGVIYKVAVSYSQPFATLAVRQNKVMVDTIANTNPDEVYVYNHWKPAYQKLEEICQTTAEGK